MAMFEVEIKAPGSSGVIRQVEVPDARLDETPLTDQVLELIFRYGQNEVQNQPCPSVSLGDVIRYLGKRYLVEHQGFTEIPPDSPGGNPILNTIID